MRDSDIRDLPWSETSKYGTIIHYKRKLAELEQQLSSERERADRLQIFRDDAIKKELQLRDQLAAERDDRISWQELYEKTNEQLAAEREKRERAEADLFNSGEKK